MWGSGNKSVLSTCKRGPPRGIFLRIIQILIVLDKEKATEEKEGKNKRCYF